MKCFFILLAVLWTNVFAAEVVSKRITSAVHLDGVPDKAWQTVPFRKVYNGHDDVVVRIKSLHDDSHVYFLVKYADSTESRFHKRWQWSKDDGVYKINKESEDVFVFKWVMGLKPYSISLKQGLPHHADIWFWKANRTDPVGFSDDKSHTLSLTPIAKGKSISTSGGIRYLVRKADDGKASYVPTIPAGLSESVISNYTSVTPTGSRADVFAKGKWDKGEWTIEFKRKLITSDKMSDVQFSDLSGIYYFGFSIYEIAGRKVDPSLTSPRYGSGDVGDLIRLKFIDE